jgi:Fibronectin type III domain/NPCBM-associated, NEW3 domain of alpha-galactosidase
MPLSSGSMHLSPVSPDSRRPSRPGRLFRSRRWRSARPAVLTLVTATAVVAGAGLAAAPAEAAAATVVWVSPSGNDGNPGTSRQQPLRTPERARDVVRSMNRNMAGDIAVTLLPGTYRLAQPLALDAQDSGTDGHTVAWTAAPGARPVFSGAVQITGWQRTSPGSAVWSAPVPAGLATRQLYVDGVRAQRARGPVPVTLTSTSTGYTASAPTMASWRNPGQIELVFTGGDGYWGLRTGGLGGWTEPRCPVASISGTTITMAQPCWDNSTRRVNRTDGSGRTVNLVGPSTLGNSQRPAYVENAFELLDQPGEWYLDSPANTVYYVPRQGEDLRRADVEAPVLETLVSGHGTADAPIHDIVFNGIEFSYATWLTPSTPEGFSEIQANYTITGPNGYATQGLCQFIDGGTCPYGSWTKTPGNVSFSYDRNVRFLDNAFVHLGGAGLDLGTGTQNSVVKGCVFTDISGNGLDLGGVDKPLPATAADRTSGNQILDNHLYSLPVEYHGGVAIDVGYTEHTTITHNQIDHTGYTAISLGWGGWPDKIRQPATPNYSNHNTVADNLISDPMQLLADGGGIYTQGITGTSLADGEHLTGNVILRSLDHGHAIYTDNGATYVTASGNVLFGNENDWGSRHTDYRPGQSGSDPTVIENNYWQQGDADSSSNNITVAGNHIIASLDEVPPEMLARAGLEPTYRHILAQRFSRPAAPDAPALVTAFGADGSAYVAWNPSFVDHGPPVTGYVVTASPGGQTATVSMADFQRLGYTIVPGLTNGVAYTFTVAAVSSFGTGPASLPSPAVTPTASLGAVPGAPASFRVRPGQNAVSLHWNPPAATGGTPIIGYTISVRGADGTVVSTTTFTGHTAVWANSSREIFTTIGGLRQLTPYTFEVSTVNAAGAGPPAVSGTVILAPTSACAGASLAVTPRAALTRPGSTATATATLANACAMTLHAAQLYLFAPRGYHATPPSPVALGDIAPGQSATQTFTVGVPADAATSADLVWQAVWSDDNGRPQGLRTTSTVNVPAASLAAAFNNVGITDDANTAAGDIDGSGSSFSAQALAGVGVTPGAAVTFRGLTFAWPNMAAGQRDNAVCAGQAFNLTGSGATLGFLLTASYGPASGTGQVVYADGSTQSFTIAAPDWFSGGTSPDIAITTPYRNRPAGRDNHPVYVFYAAVPLQAGKTVAAVVLPDVSGATPQARVPSLHVFAAAIG